MEIPTVTLKDGKKHPLIGFGTYKVGVVPGSSAGSSGVPTPTGGDVKAIIKAALAAGYRCFDCAQFYLNEKLVGEALAESGIPREQLYIISKVWTDKVFGGAETVRAQFNQTRADLRVDYLDLYLIHWPVPVKHIEGWKVLEDLQREGLVRSIGVSNYSVEDYLELKPHCKSLPVLNQIEVNPFLYRKKTIDFFQKEGVVIQAYRPLANGKQMNNPILVQLSKKYNHSPGQILGRWCLQHNIIYLPKSEKPDRIKENIAILDFKISDEDMATLDSQTTPAAIEAYKTAYYTGLYRDTPMNGSKEGFKTVFTFD